MDPFLSTPTRRDLLAAAAAAGVSNVLFPSSGEAEVGSAEAVRPFHVDIPEEGLSDFRRRLAMTRWPDRETLVDRSQGVQLARLQALVHYWGTNYDWRKIEAKLNALPQFMTTIDSVEIYFIHVRSPLPKALP